MSDALRAENARLAARVAELEGQLAAKPPIDRASLYRLASHAPWGVLVVNAQDRIDFANPAMQRWLQVPAPAMGERRADAVTAELAQTLDAPIPRALGGEAFETTLSLRDAAGELRAVKLNVNPRGGGPQGITGAAVSLYDITENEALARSMRENEARLAHIAAVTPSVNYIFDFRAGAPIWVTGRTDAVYGHTAEELLRGGPDFIRQLIHPDDIHKVGERLAELTARPDGDVVEFELRVRHGDGAYHWILDRAVAFARNSVGQVIRTLSAAIDIDGRKRAEEHRTLLINELNHRVKNTLASVQSIARQTLRVGRSPEQTIDLFTDRLVALSVAHDVLTRENWEGASLREIAEGALGPFAEQGAGRIAIEGRDVRLSARAAVDLTMALHELATNASKYGALSNETGRTHLAWRVAGTGDHPRLELEWRESGGPPVTPPSRRGFGSRLLTQGLPAELNGTAELQFAPGGVVCRITAPLQPLEPP
jgi:PAS domain S-box-containing protein